MNLTEEDFDCRYAKFFEWVADNQLRKFRIIRRDGTIKEILFSEMLENQKIVERLRIFINNINIEDSITADIVNGLNEILGEEK